MNDLRFIHLVVSWLGLMGCFMGIVAWIVLVARPYARLLRRAKGDSGNIYLLEIETEIRASAETGDLKARRILAVMKRIMQAGLFFALSFVAFTILW